jgi:hypothetical protein
MENKTDREKDATFPPLIAIQEAVYLPDKFYLRYAMFRYGADISSCLTLFQR